MMHCILHNFTAVLNESINIKGMALLKMSQWLMPIFFEFVHIMEGFWSLLNNKFASEDTVVYVQYLYSCMNV